MKKRFLALFLALVMCLGMLPVTALAADKVEIKWLPDGIVPCVYIKETGRILAFDDTSWYFFDKNGAVITKFDTTAFDGAATYFGFSDGLLSVEKDGKYGFIDQTGKVVIPTIYDFSDAYFSGGLTAVGTGKDQSSAKWGYINTSGQLVIPMDYDAALDFSDGLAAVEQNGKWGYIDTTGKTIIPLVYDSASSFNGGVAVVGTGKDWSSKKYGLIDVTGRLVLPIEYDHLYDFGEALTAYKGGKLGFLDRTGKAVIPFFSYGDDIEADVGHGVVSEGRVALYNSDRNTYYIDMTGKTFGGVYDMGRDFSEGLAYAKQNGKSGFIDTSGNFAFYLDVPEGYEVLVSGWYGPRFVNGIAIVGLSNLNTGDFLAGVVDKQGNVIVPFQYEDAMLLDDCFGYVKKDGRYGIFFNPNATTHPTTPDQPSTLPAVEPIPAAGTAKPATQTVLLDGKKVEFQCYALLDAKGNPSNYVKIRDLALALNGTKAQFNVGWDGSKIVIETGKAYQANGSENKTTYAGDQKYESVSGNALSFNGQSVNLTSINIQNGNTYYKLRDLGQLMNFNVMWNGSSIVVETDKPYTG